MDFYCNLTIFYQKSPFWGKIDLFCVCFYPKHMYVWLQTRIILSQSQCWNGKLSMIPVSFLINVTVLIHEWHWRILRPQSGNGRTDSADGPPEAFTRCSGSCYGADKSSLTAPEGPGGHSRRTPLFRISRQWHVARTAPCIYLVVHSTLTRNLYADSFEASHMTHVCVDSQMYLPR